MFIISSLIPRFNKPSHTITNRNFDLADKLTGAGDAILIVPALGAISLLVFLGPLNSWGTIAGFTCAGGAGFVFFSDLITLFVRHNAIKSRLEKKLNKVQKELNAKKSDHTMAYNDHVNAEGEGETLRSELEKIKAEFEKLKGESDKQIKQLTQEATQARQALEKANSQPNPNPLNEQQLKDAQAVAQEADNKLKKANQQLEEKEKQHQVEIKQVRETINEIKTEFAQLQETNRYLREAADKYAGMLNIKKPPPAEQPPALPTSSSATTQVATPPPTTTATTQPQPISTTPPPPQPQPQSAPPPPPPPPPPPKVEPQMPTTTNTGLTASLIKRRVGELKKQGLNTSAVPKLSDTEKGKLRDKLSGTGSSMAATVGAKQARSAISFAIEGFKTYLENKNERLEAETQQQITDLCQSISMQEQELSQPQGLEYSYVEEVKGSTEERYEQIPNEVRAYFETLYKYVAGASTPQEKQKRIQECYESLAEDLEAMLDELKQGLTKQVENDKAEKALKDLKDQNETRFKAAMKFIYEGKAYDLEKVDFEPLCNTKNATGSQAAFQAITKTDLQGVTAPKLYDMSTNINNAAQNVKNATSEETRQKLINELEKLCGNMKQHLEIILGATPKNTFIPQMFFRKN